MSLLRRAISKDYIDKLNDISPLEGTPKDLEFELSKQRKTFGDYLVNDVYYVINRMYDYECGLPNKMALEVSSRSIGLMWARSYCMVTMVLSENKNVAILTSEDIKETIVIDSLPDLVIEVFEYIKLKSSYFNN